MEGEARPPPFSRRQGCHSENSVGKIGRRNMYAVTFLLLTLGTYVKYPGALESSETRESADGAPQTVLSLLCSFDLQKHQASRRASSRGPSREQRAS